MNDSPWVKAMTLPPWLDFPFPLPEEVEVRSDGDLAALHLLGTDRVVGFKAKSITEENLTILLERLK